MIRELTETIQLPSGFHARFGELSDYLLLFDLVNEYSLRTNGRIEINDPELILLDWRNDGFNPQTDTRAVFNPEGKLVGLLESWLTHKPPVHPWNWVCVHPDYMDLGIWEYLLQWGENRSRKALDIVPTELRVAAVTGTDHNNQAAIEIIKKLGWTHIRSYYRMMTNLDSPPEVPSIPEGIVIRSYYPGTENEAVYRAFADSFKDHFGFVEQPFEQGFAEFKHNLIEDPGYDPSYWFVAVDGDEIAGICLCRHESSQDLGSGWVNELGIRRPWRKKGLGYALLKKSFAEFYARGQKRAALGVDASSLTGALRLYERAGMHVDHQYDNFEKEFRPGLEIRTQEVK